MSSGNDLADLHHPSRDGGSNNPLDCLNRLGGQTHFADKHGHETVSPDFNVRHEECVVPKNLIEEFDPGSA